MPTVLGAATGQDARHHRHWQGVLYRVSGLRLTTLPLPLPDSGTVLGGSLELHGKTISLACFHGINFRSMSWALFSLQEPYINFTSEVQEVPGDRKFMGNSIFCSSIFQTHYCSYEGTLLASVLCPGQNSFFS